VQVNTAAHPQLQLLHNAHFALTHNGQPCNTAAVGLCFAHIGIFMRQVPPQQLASSLHCFRKGNFVAMAILM
jgi:hypothetical protein